MEAITQNIYRHTLDAFRKGKPHILHYDSDLLRRAERRTKALDGLPVRITEGLQRDEYPYASTFEGGEGALVAYVPSRENSSQGGQLRALYSNMKQGEAFLVLPVPKDKEPDTEKETSPNPTPVIFPMPIPKFIPNALKPVFRVLQQFLTPIFDPSLLNDLDKYNPNRYKGTGVMN